MSGFRLFRLFRGRAQDDRRVLPAITLLDADGREILDSRDWPVMTTWRIAAADLMTQDWLELSDSNGSRLYARKS